MPYQRFPTRVSHVRGTGFLSDAHHLGGDCLKPRIGAVPCSCLQGRTWYGCMEKQNTDGPWPSTKDRIQPDPLSTFQISPEHTTRAGPESVVIGTSAIPACPSRVPGVTPPRRFFPTLKFSSPLAASPASKGRGGRGFDILMRRARVQASPRGF